MTFMHNSRYERVFKKRGDVDSEYVTITQFYLPFSVSIQVEPSVGGQYVDSECVSFTIVFTY